MTKDPSRDSKLPENETEINSKDKTNVDGRGLKTIDDATYIDQSKTSLKKNIPQEKCNEKTIDVDFQKPGYEKTIDVDFESTNNKKMANVHFESVTSKTAKPKSLSYLGRSTTGKDITIENLSSLSNEERYEVKRMLGKGGMGVVMLVKDNVLQREIAMKLIKNENKKSSSYQRFLQEAQITGFLEHPNIIPIYDLSSLEDMYFTMRLVDGFTLNNLIQGLKKEEEAYSNYSLRKRLQIIINVCYALEYAHSKNIIHRDLKPDNIMIGQFGQVLVLDWGLAKSIHGQEASTDIENNPDDDDESTDNTKSGTLIGTPRYMAPEQAMGKVKEIDKSTDIYSLGAILYELITLEPVFKAPDLFALIDMIVHTPVEKKRYNSIQEIIPNELISIATKALAKEKKERYLSVSLLRKDIELFLEGRSVTAAPDNWYGKLEKLIVRNIAVSMVLFLSLAFLGVFYHFFSINESIAVVQEKILVQQKNILIENILSQVTHNMQLYNQSLNNKNQKINALRSALIENVNDLQLELVEIETEVKSYGKTIYTLCNHILSLSENPQAKEILAHYLVKDAEDTIQSQKNPNFNKIYSQLQKATELLPSLAPQIAKISQKISSLGTINITKISPETLKLYKIDHNNKNFSPEYIQDIISSGDLELSIGSYIIKNEDRNTSFPFVIQPHTNSKITVYNTKNVPKGFVFIPSGTFYIGAKYLFDEYQEKVEVKSYYIQQHEVTFAEYLDFYRSSQNEKHIPKILISGTSENLWDTEQQLKFGLTLECPVFGITYYAAKDFCDWKTKKTGTSFDLPKVREWEKAARGVDGRIYSWGNTKNSMWANVHNEQTFGKLLPIGSIEKDVSIYGVRDMMGNIAEWTQTQTEEGLHLIKGGHFNSSIEDAKTYTSNAVSPNHIGFIGFRCVSRSIQIEQN